MEINKIPLLKTDNPSFIGAWTPNDVKFLDNAIEIFNNNSLSHQEIRSTQRKSNKEKKNKKQVNGFVANFDLNNNKMDKSDYNTFSLYTNFLDSCFKSYASRWEFTDYNLIGLSPSTIQIVNLMNIDSDNLAFNYMKSEGKFMQTSFSFLTFLTDSSNLGKVEFYYQGVTIKSMKGLTLIWPSDWTHSNRILGAKDNSDFYFITGSLGHYNLNQAKVGMSFDSIQTKYKNYKKDK